MSAKINFEQARQDHLAWMYKMRNFLNGIEELKREEIVSHLNCRLGKWFYSEGKEEFGELEPVKKFELKHIKLHQLAKDIFELKNIGNIVLAEDLYEDLERTSKQIVWLLNEAEHQINQSLELEEITIEEEVTIPILDKLLDWDKSKNLLLKLDANGLIEYANQNYLEVSEFESVDLLGKSSDFVRHPDMPITINNWTWKEIEQGIETSVIVKNLAKSGKYFWVIIDYKLHKREDNSIEHITIKHSGINMSLVYKHIVPLYNQLLFIEQNKGIEASEKFLKGFLEERNRTFDEFTRNLIMTGRDSIKGAKKGFLSRIFGRK